MDEGHAQICNKLDLIADALIDGNVLRAEIRNELQTLNRKLAIGHIEVEVRQ